MRLRWLLPIALLLGFLTAAGTTFVNRPQTALSFGDCASDENNPYGLCRTQHPRGGWPLIHIVDARTGGNQGKLGLEDQIYLVSLGGNTAGFAAIWMTILGIYAIVAGRRRPDGPETFEAAAAEIDLAQDAPPEAPEPDAAAKPPEA